MMYNNISIRINRYPYNTKKDEKIDKLSLKGK